MGLKQRLMLMRELLRMSPRSRLKTRHIRLKPRFMLVMRAFVGLGLWMVAGCTRLSRLGPGIERHLGLGPGIGIVVGHL